MRRLVRARSSQQSRSAAAFLRVMVWNAAITSRASTSRGTSFSIAAIVTVSDFESVSRPMVRSRAKVLEDGMRRRLPASTFSACPTSRTDRPANGKSLRRRRYRLWTRSERAPHPGQGFALLMCRTVITAVTPSQTALATSKPYGARASGRRVWCTMLIPL